MTVTKNPSKKVTFQPHLHQISSTVRKIIVAIQNNGLYYFPGHFYCDGANAINRHNIVTSKLLVSGSILKMVDKSSSS